jgi:glycosyltransferase involved in cell wall biosynthesis
VKNKMKVSVITPSFNQGPYIESTLKSVIAQDGVNIEHVVVDGGSTDETISILKQAGNVVSWTSQRDNGQADAVNKGICATQGEIIGWLNSDDVYYPGAVAQAVQYFIDYPEIDVVYGMADHIGADGAVLGRYPTEPWSFDRLKETCFICQPALFFRRRAVEQFGLLDVSLNYCMDYEYWLRLGFGGAQFLYVKEKWAGSRMYPENKTMGFRREVHHEINGMLKKWLGRVPDKWLLGYADIVAGQYARRGMGMFFLHSVISSLRWNRDIPWKFVLSLLKMKASI